jgi:hypothetical protein
MLISGEKKVEQMHRDKWKFQGKLRNEKPDKNQVKADYKCSPVQGIWNLI